MSKQHFYSRVPARMSIFNRMDGLDTFAYSDGLDREFIEKDLASIYDNKPSKNDTALINEGKLPPIYCHKYTKQGVMIQGCISYLAHDYTGERSTCFVHSLAFDEKEEKGIISSPDNNILTKEMFKTDIADFDLTSEDASPCTDYPELNYMPSKAQGTDILAQSYDSAMLKRLIFCILETCCGKSKPVYISLPCPISELSEKALEFFNTILQIFPYHLRKYISFVTYTDDTPRFSSFNFRFIPENTKEIPAAKGVTLHFGSNLTLGLPDEMVASSGLLVEFFYNMLKSDKVRRDFLVYMQNAVEKKPELCKTNMKTLTELVFIFQQCSGLFAEKNIIPNDQRMFDYICAYEKHREALSDEYRTTALKCLTRYSQNKLAIPKDVFSKVAKIYPSEPTASKRIVMDVVLELIHTDIMRDKLFSFIKSNFATEDAEIRAQICDDLCRVYYGGFLQTQILGFFEQYFHEESEQTKDRIVEKLLLTIRTESVKPRIISFFDTNFDKLSDNQKSRFYSMFYEMLNDCDSLTVELIKLVDRHFESDNETFVTELSDKLYKVAENDRKFAEPKFIGILLENFGYCSSLFTKRVFEHTSSKLFDSFVSAFKKLQIDIKIPVGEKILAAVADSDKASLFANTLCDIYAGDTAKEPVDIYQLISAEKALSESDTPSKKAFAQIVSTKLVKPAVLSHINEAFSVKKNKKGLDAVIEYAADKEYLKNSDEYGFIAKYQSMREAALQNNPDKLLDGADILLDKQVRAGAVEHFDTDVLKNPVLDDEKYALTRFLAEVIYTYLKSKELDLYSPYISLMTAIAARKRTENPKMNQDTAERLAADDALEVLIQASNAVYGSEVFAEFKDTLFGAAESLSKALTAFSSKEPKAKKLVAEYLQQKGYASEFSEKVNSLMNLKTNSGGGFFKKLFGKK